MVDNKRESKKMDKAEERAQVIKEYLVGDTSSRKLGQKYGYSFATIARWVMVDKEKKNKEKLLQASKDAAIQKEKLPVDVKQLQRDLRDSQLKVSLLEAMIDISDTQFGTDIRKKAGTRPSKK